MKISYVDLKRNLIDELSVASMAMDLDEYNSIKETLYLISNSVNYEKLIESLQEMNSTMRIMT